MNYRQWKKNYKKKHGVNPPIIIDKRKQVRFIKKDMPYILERTARMLSIAFDNASKALHKMAESMKSEVADSERD